MPQALLTVSYLTSWCTAVATSQSAVSDDAPPDRSLAVPLATEPFNSVSWTVSTIFWFYVAL